MYLDEYKFILDEFINFIKLDLKGFVLMLLFIIDDNKNDVMRKKMDEYRFVMKEIV